MALLTLTLAHFLAIVTDIKFLTNPIVKIEVCGVVHVCPPFELVDSQSRGISDRKKEVLTCRLALPRSGPS